MQFGLSLVLSDPRAFPALMARAEEVGFDYLGVQDTQVYREMTVNLTRALDATRTSRMGPLVSNPLTRHPAPAANAIASLDELYHGRLVWGLATGDTAVATLGLRPAPLNVLREYVHVARELLQGHEAKWGGKVVQVPWARTTVPIFIAADGPRGLRLVGEIADGVISGIGMTPDVLKAAKEYVADGARGAGRSPSEIEFWSRGAIAISDDPKMALEYVKPAIAAQAHHALRPPLEGKFVPPELRKGVERLQREYNVMRHSSAGGDNPNARLIDETGLTPYLAERWGLFGTPAQVAKRIGELEARGVTRLSVRPIARDLFEFFESWREVMARLASRTP